MGNIGDTITQPIPVVGTSGTAYATQINAFLTEVKARLEAAIPVGSLLVGDLDLNNNALLGASYVGLYQNSTADTDATGSLQNINGDLYYIDSTGAIQLTTAGVINSSSIGGITGDYGGSNPAQLRFDDGSKVYQHYDDFSGLAWAYTRQLGVDIAGSSTSLVRARILWTGSSSVDITLPATLPANTALLQMTSAGVMTATNTLATDQDLTLQGTGDLKHGDWQTTHLAQPIFDGTITNIIQAGVAPALFYRLNGATLTTNIPLQGLRVGDRIKTVQLYGDEGGGTNPTISLILQFSGGITITTSSSGTFSGTGSTTLTVTTPADGVVTPGNIFALRVTSGSVLADLYTVLITYDHP